MLRSVTYRNALHAFIFTALWLVIGGAVLWSPLPGALGIATPMFVAWLLLFFAMLAVGGALLTLAALNVAFPPTDAGQRPSPPRTRKPTAPRPPEPVRSSQPPLWAPGTPRPQTTGADAGGAKPSSAIDG